MRALARAYLLAAAAALVAVATAAAEDVTDLNPPMIGVHEIRDANGIVSLQVPARTSDQGCDTSHPFPIARFGLILHNQKPNDTPEATLWIDDYPDFGRAALAHAIKVLPGAPDEAFHRTGDGVWEETRRDEAGGRRYFFRWIEHEDRVLSLGFGAPPTNFDKFRPHFERIAGSLKILRTPPRAEIGAGMIGAVVDGRELRTDRKDRKGAKKLLEMHLEAWKGAAAVLGADLRWKGPPILVVLDSAENVAKHFSTGTEPFIDVNSRAAVCCTKQDAKHAGALQRLAVLQYVRAMYGGPCPDFVESGMVQWAYAGIVLGGKPGKVPGSELTKLRAAVAERDTTMPGLWKVRVHDLPKDELQAAVYDLWAWHLFFRHAPSAAEWAPLYQKSLDALRDPGDPAAAEKVWDGVDGAAMRKAMVEWLASWKP
jgi:hypothetical protein